jgi:hypothetical protein
VIIIVTYKNKTVARYEIADDSFVAPSGHGFRTIGTSKETGQPIVVNLDEVLSIGPEEDNIGPLVG